MKPGFCKTTFTGFRGTSDPVLGAAVVVRPVLDEEGAYGIGDFWEWGIYTYPLVWDSEFVIIL